MIFAAQCRAVKCGWPKMVFVWIAGLIVGAGLSAAMMISLPSYEHDPQKMLALRAECLKDSPNLFTTYCDHFAEQYSRIAK
jgi:hypothetical protein